MLYRYYTVIPDLCSLLVLFSYTGIIQLYRYCTVIPVLYGYTGIVQLYRNYTVIPVLYSYAGIVKLYRYAGILSIQIVIQYTGLYLYTCMIYTGINSIEMYYTVGNPIHLIC